MLKETNMKKEWISSGGIGGNVILQVDDSFFISYNPDLSGLGEFFDADGGGAETALVNSQDYIEYRILNGDFRAQYEEVIEQGFEACLAIYEKLREEFDSSWTGQ